MWTSLVNQANAVGQADLAWQNSKHSRQVYALALVAVRTQNASLKTKAISEIREAMGTEANTDEDCDEGERYGAKSLSLGRNLIGYIVAADILDYRAPDFVAWARAMRDRPNCPQGAQSRPFSLVETHDESGSNGSTLAGASRVAVDYYIGDAEALADAEAAYLTFRRYLGDRTVGKEFNFNDETWMHNRVEPVALNPRGATCAGKNFPADGVIVNDQSRGGDCPRSLNLAPGYTQYPWEGLQGAYALALLFDRAGKKEVWQLQDSALQRAVLYQKFLQDTFGGEWFDTTRAAWVKHLANRQYQLTLPTSNAIGGRNIDYTQWTHP